MKKYLLIGLTITLSLALIGCKPDHRGSDDPKDDPPLQTDYTMEDFYADLVVYEEKLETILLDAPNEEGNVPSSDFLFLAGEWDEYVTTITRDEILAVHNEHTHDIVHESYYEQLLTTKMFVETIISVIDGAEVELNQDYFPEELDNTAFRFLQTDEGYLLIDALYGTHHHYLKIGLNEDLLEYQEFQYYFDVASTETPRDSITMNFNYSTFLEGKTATHINYSDQYSSLSHIDIENDEEFTISVGNGIIEQEEHYQDAGYVLNRFDRETNSRAYLQVVNNEIISETYDIFDEHGQVFRYQDHQDVLGNIRLQINFVTATGWDYVVVSDGSNDEIDQLTGVFTSDGTKIYDPWFNYTYTDTYGHLGLWIDLEEGQELTNELFSLNQYGMNLDHPYATVEHFNNVKLDNFEEIKDTFVIDGLDFFADDLHGELYNFVDVDIRNDIEGATTIPIEPIITTGDVLEFNTAMEQYLSNQEANRSYNSSSTTTTSYYNQSDQLVGSLVVNDYTHYDLDRLLFRYASTTSGMDHSSYGYYVDGTSGTLLEFERTNEVYVEYDILEQEATEERFNHYVSLFQYDNATNNIKNITQINDYEFEVTLDPHYLMVDGISMITLYEQMGITGLGDQDIVSTIIFSETFTDYVSTYTIDGLTFTDGETTMSIEIDNMSVTTLEEIPYDVQSPLDNTSYKMYLPDSVEDAFITYEYGSFGVGLRQGYQYMKFHVAPGEYEVAVYGQHTHGTVTIYDENMNEIPYEEDRFEATYDGVYYAKVYSNMDQGATVYIRDNPTPNLYDFAFDSEAGVFTATVSLEGITGSVISVPTATYDRILIIDGQILSAASEEQDFFIMYRNEDLYMDFDCMFWQDSMGENNTCYIYLAGGYDIELNLDGYFSGEFMLTYSYIDVPEGVFDNNHTWTDIYTPLEIILTPETPEARVDFTINESGTYVLNTLYQAFKWSYQDAVLYDSEGNQLHYDWEYPMELTPGDYYIIFNTNDVENTLVFIKTVIEKQ